MPGSTQRALDDYFEKPVTSAKKGLVEAPSCLERVENCYPEGIRPLSLRIGGLHIEWTRMGRAVESVAKIQGGWVYFVTPGSETRWSWSCVNLVTHETRPLVKSGGGKGNLWEKATDAYGRHKGDVFGWLDEARFARVVVSKLDVDEKHFPVVADAGDQWWVWDARFVPDWVRAQTHPNVLRILKWSTDTGLDQGTERWKIAHDDMWISGSICNDLTGTGYKGFGPQRGIEGYQKQILEKTGNNPEPFSGNEATRHGQKWEGAALEKTALVLKTHIFEVGLMKRDVGLGEAYKDRVGGSADGITSDNQVLEVKCPYFRKIKAGEFPAYYDLQPQFYMMLLEVTHSKFVQYRPKDCYHYDDIEMDIVDVPYDKAAMDNCLKIGVRFMDEIIRIKQEGGDLSAETKAYKIKRKRCRFLTDAQEVAKMHRKFKKMGVTPIFDEHEDEPEGSVSLPEIWTDAPNEWDTFYALDIDSLYEKVINTTIDMFADEDWLKCLQ
jgi:hypothetical protein